MAQQSSQLAKGSLIDLRAREVYDFQKFHELKIEEIKALKPNSSSGNGVVSNRDMDIWQSSRASILGSMDEASLVDSANVKSIAEITNVDNLCHELGKNQEWLLRLSLKRSGQAVDDPNEGHAVALIRRKTPPLGKVSTQPKGGTGHEFFFVDANTGFFRIADIASGANAKHFVRQYFAKYLNDWQVSRAVEISVDPQKAQPSLGKEESLA